MRTASLHTLPFRPPASPTQRRVWLTEKDALDRARYNLSYCWRISGRFVPGAFHGALAAVVARHEALRTTFTLIEGSLLRVLHEQLPPRFTLVEDVPVSETTAHALAEAEECIDLSQGPMMRCLVLRHGPQDHTVVLTTHHIAVDGRSMGIVREELAHEYALRIGAASGGPLPAPQWQFGDFAFWQQERTDTGDFDPQLRYWKRQLAGIDAPVELPFAKPRPKTRQVAARWQPLVCPPPLTRAVRELAVSAKASLSAVLMAGFARWLADELGAAEVVIGMSVGGRSMARFDRVVGLCTNTVPLRIRLDRDAGPVDLIDRVRAVMLDALENQDVPLAAILQQQRLARSVPINPFSQVLVALRDGLGDPLRLPGADVVPFPSPSLSTSQDFVAELGPLPDGTIGGGLLYPVDLVEAHEAERIAAQVVETYARMTATSGVAGTGANRRAEPPADPASSAPVDTAPAKPGTAAGPGTPADSGASADHYDPRVRDHAARIWLRLLGLPEVRDEDDFFALGGDSLLAAELVGELAEAVGIALPSSLPARAPTLAALASAVTELLAEQGARQ